MVILLEFLKFQEAVGINSLDPASKVIFQEEVTTLTAHVSPLGCRLNVLPCFTGDRLTGSDPSNHEESQNSRSRLCIALQ